MPAARVLKPPKAAPPKPSSNATQDSAYRIAPTNRRPATIGSRIRKNIKNLTQDEWSRFVQALKVMKNRTRPGGVIPIYDEFCAIHMGAVEMHKAWRREHGNGVENADPGHDNPSYVFPHDSHVHLNKRRIKGFFRSIVNFFSNSRLPCKRLTLP